MRGTSHNKAFLSIDENAENPFGICLGADFCAEHEWGIKKLKSRLNIVADEPGISSHIVGKKADFDSIRVFAGEQLCMIISAESYHFEKWTPLFENGLFENRAKKGEYPFRDYLERPNYDRNDKLASDWEFSASWDESDFMVIARKKYAPFFHELKKAAENQNLAIWLGGGGAFDNAGLTLALVDRIPAEALETMRASAQAKLDAANALDASGLEKKLTKAGKRWFALSPRLIDAEECKKWKTSHPIIIWLNPYEQHIHNYGWFTVEQLELWAEDKGPVIMSAKKA